MSEEKEQVTIEDYIIQEKLDAFTEHFAPASDEPYATELDDVKLRSFFKAYVTAHGDPLKWYLGRLKEKGFRMTVSIVSTEPVIRVVEKFV